MFPHPLRNFFSFETKELYVLGQLILNEEMPSDAAVYLVRRFAISFRLSQKNLQALQARVQSMDDKEKGDILKRLPQPLVFRLRW